MAWLRQKTSRDDIPAMLAHRISGLQHEARQLGHALGGYRHDLQHGAHEMGDVLLREGLRLAQRFGRSAGRAGEAVRRDPAPAIAMVVVAGCLLSLVLSRNSGRK